MSKFKVGDKVLTPNGEKGKITKINENYVVVEYLLNDVIEQTFYTHALRLQKTPHERLLELGWKLIHEDENMIIYNKSLSKSLSFHKKQANCFTDERNIDLQLAEVLVDYLKELEK